VTNHPREDLPRCRLIAASWIHLTICSNEIRSLELAAAVENFAATQVSRTAAQEQNALEK
jgi:hypothetical protein